MDLDERGDVPVLRLALGSGAEALRVLQALQSGRPAVYADPSRMADGMVVFNPSCLRPGESAVIAARVRSLIGPSAGGE